MEDKNKEIINITNKLLDLISERYDIDMTKDAKLLIKKTGKYECDIEFNGKNEDLAFMLSKLFSLIRKEGMKTRVILGTLIDMEMEFDEKAKEFFINKFKKYIEE